MNQLIGHRRSSRAAGMLAFALALAGCTDALLQPQAKDESAVDDRLTLRGEVCTAAPDPANFPVKVVFLIDKSGSMCVSDPPGSQLDNGFCQQFAGNHTEPGRVRALRSIIERFQDQPNVQVALDPFESKIDSAFPTGQGNRFFVPAADLGEQRIRALQANLGKGTDYQGALAQAYWRIESDILATNPIVRPRTRYVVVLLTDGAPYPRCAATDDLPAESYASADQPWGIWRDNPEDFCNASDAGEYVTGFLGGTDRNQNYQILDAVDRLMELKEKYNVGDVRLHTILLFNVAAARACGDLCATDLYNGLSADEMRSVATWMLRQIAEVHGNGTFQEFTDSSSIELGALDYTSLASKFAVKTLLASNVNAVPGLDGPKVDSDGDGLPDELDSPFALGTSRFDVDTDGDGFSDAFEVLRREQGFDPLVPDGRGCKDVNGPARYSCRDTDGDGLSEAAEAYLGTDPTLFDTDADGIPDGVEAMYGLSPVTRNDDRFDWDLDGIGDLTEILWHTNPVLNDPIAQAKDAYRYQIEPVEQEDGSICYRFQVSNIRLVTPDRRSGQLGHNLVTLTFGEAPESNVSRDFGAWRMACAWAQFVAPNIRVPAEQEIVLTNDDFFPPDQLTDTSATNLCKGVAP